MSNAKHTPGPWNVFHHSWCETSICAPGFDHGICFLDINHATEESQEADEALMAANARLIAAAPDLLKALIALEREKADYMRLNNLGDPAREHNTIMARAAIAKATGEAK